MRLTELNECWMSPSVLQQMELIQWWETSRINPRKVVVNGLNGNVVVSQFEPQSLYSLSDKYPWWRYERSYLSSYEQIVGQTDLFKIYLYRLESHLCVK